MSYFLSIYSYEAYVSLEQRSPDELIELLKDNNLENIDEVQIQSILINNITEKLGQFLYVIDDNNILLDYGGDFFLATKKS